MIRFGTGGWRALIGDDFIKSNIRLLAQALAEQNNALGGADIVIGYDRRFLSENAAQWVAEVLAGNGIRVLLINKSAPTPLIMFTVKDLGIDRGLAITASHNPAEYNGIKIFTSGGRDADEEVTHGLEDIIDTLSETSIKSIPYEKALRSGKILVINPFNDYIDAILKLVDTDVMRKRNSRVLLDPMYGVSRTSLQTLLLTARCEVDTIHDRRDTLFGGRLPSPSAATLLNLRNIVIEGGYDIGIGTDGDADRIGLIDENGTFVHPNDILVLLYYYLQKYKGWKGDVVRNVCTTHRLDRLAESFGMRCHEVPVGFKHISSKMDEVNAVIGGESSGGLTIRGHISGKDGIFAAALLVEMLCVTGKKLSEVMSEIRENFGHYEIVEDDIRFDPSLRESLTDTLYVKKELPAFSEPVLNVNYMDGVKVNFANGGWVTARFSGTEPLLRIYSEMPEDIALCHKVCGEFRAFLGV